MNAQQASDEVKQLLLRKKKSNAATTAVSFGEIWDDCTKVHNLGVVKLEGLSIGKVLLPATLYSDEENDAAAAPALLRCSCPAAAAAAAAAATAAAAKAEEERARRRRRRRRRRWIWSMRCDHGSRVRYVVNGFYPKMREPFIACRQRALFRRRVGQSFVLRSGRAFLRSRGRRSEKMCCDVSVKGQGSVAAAESLR